MNGKVKWFNSKKGYGFITAIDGWNNESDVFVHYSNIDSDGYKVLNENDEVEFDILEGEKGYTAVSVKLKNK